MIVSGVSVERRSLPAGTFVDATDAAKGSKHACVRSSGDRMLRQLHNACVHGCYLISQNAQHFMSHIYDSPVQRKTNLL
jgi:hypothetical protein